MENMNHKIHDDNEKVVDSLLSSAELFKYKLDELERVKAQHEMLIEKQKTYSTTIQHLESKCNALSNTVIDMEKSNDYLQRKIGRLNVQLSNLSINLTKEQKKYRKAKEKCEHLSKKQYFMVTEVKKLLDKLADTDFRLSSIENFEKTDEIQDYASQALFPDNINSINHKKKRNKLTHQTKVFENSSEDSLTDEESLMNEPISSEVDKSRINESSFSERIIQTPMQYSLKHYNDTPLSSPTYEPLSAPIFKTHPLNLNKISLPLDENNIKMRRTDLISTSSSLSSVTGASRTRQNAFLPFKSQSPNSQANSQGLKSNRSSIHFDRNLNFMKDINHISLQEENIAKDENVNNSRLVKFLFSDNESLRDILDSKHIDIMFKKITDEVLTFDKDIDLQTVFDNYEKLFFKKLSEGQPLIIDKLKEDMFLKFYIKGNLIKNYELKLSDLDSFLSFDNVLILGVSGF